MGSYFFKKYRGVVQLVERRSPKPDVAGSNPVSPAILNLIFYFYGPVAQVVRAHA